MQPYGGGGQGPGGYAPAPGGYTPQQGGYAPPPGMPPQPPGGPASISTPKGFFGALFDLSFSNFVTTKIIKFLFILTYFCQNAELILNWNWKC